MTEKLYYCLDCNFSSNDRDKMLDHCKPWTSDGHGWITTKLRKIPLDGKWKVADIGVDSGSMMFGDPCYVKHDESLYCAGQTIDDKDSNKVELPDKWGQLCDRYSHEEHLPHEYGGMFYTGSFGGDGEYPVTVEIKNGQVIWAKINFSGRESRLDEIQYRFEKANVEESKKQKRLVMEDVKN